jgi:hypothetical protein
MPKPTTVDKATKARSGAVVPPMPAPIMMDKVTKARLEAVSKQTPRYLFRLWSNGKPGESPSGGYHGLNTATAITPLAFFQIQGHESAYHMTKQEFTNNALQHLQWQYIATEFSSWSASLVFILNKCPGTYNESRDVSSLYVSIIDVEMLQETNQIFYVPLLDFLKPGEWNYPHKYLVYGVVKGWHKALPYVSFTNLWISGNLSFGISPPNPLTEDNVQQARKIGDLFGGEFALPITLAISCCLRRDRDLWMRGVSTKDLEIVLRGIKGLKIPESWRKRHPIVGHTISCQNFDDTKQMTMLTSALMRHFKERNYSNVQMSSRFENSDGECPHLESEEGETEGAKTKDGGRENGGASLKQDVGSPAHAMREAKDELSDAVQELERTLDGLNVDVPKDDDEGAKIEGLTTRITRAIFRIVELI